MDKLKVGVVGCGSVAQKRHIPGFLRLGRKMDFRTVCDRNGELAQSIANKYHIAKSYSEVSEMLRKEDLDLVDICTPPQTHAPLAIEAMKHGCHVLLEKPMALKVSDCDEMIHVSQQQGVKLCVVHNMLFYPIFLKARRLVAEGIIGDFLGMRIFVSNPRDEMIMRKDYWIHNLPGGLIGETGPHVVYLSLAFLNNVKAMDVYAKNFLEHPWAPFDEFRIELEGENALSSIGISYASNRQVVYVDIYGTEGVLHLDIQNMLLIRHGGKESTKPIDLARYSLSSAFQIIGGVATNAFTVMTGRVNLGHDIVIEKFIDSILNDHQPPVSGEEGREVTRVMEMIVERLQGKYYEP